jgi:DegV family protein with EDD domain
MSYTIVVDSCCDLPKKVRQSANIVIVPLTVTIGKQNFIDDETLDCIKLLQLMASSEEGTSSACPSPAAFLDAFEAAEGDIYVVTLSALLSGSHNSARQAQRIFLEAHPERNIHIFNSCSASAGETLLTHEIKTLVESGMAFHTVVADIEHKISEMNTLFVLDNLDNLRKNGRLTKIQALLTGTLHIKLVMGATPEGEICKRGQAISIKQAFAKMTDIMKNDVCHIGKTLCISQCNAVERSLLLKNMVEECCKFSRILITETAGISTVYANDGGIVAAY